MHEVTIFNNPEFGEVRTMEAEDGRVLFCDRDVAAALGYSNPRKALADHCRCVTKRDTPHPQSPDKTIEMTFIPESDVYRLAFGSKLPSAEKFTDWVTEEVLPAVRRHGAYMTPDVLEQTIRNPDYIIGICTELKAEQERRRVLEQKVQRDRPKVLFADAVAESESTILIGALAKLLKQNGVNTGQKRLFAWMRDNGYLMKTGSDYNLPTQRAMELGLFTIKESTTVRPDGHIAVNKTTKVTGKGQQYFINEFLKGRDKEA